MNIETFKKEINTLRKNSGDKWYWFTGMVEDKEVKIKGHKTWLQVFEVNGIRMTTCMDISVKQFNEKLIQGVSYTDPTI